MSQIKVIWTLISTGFQHENKMILN